ncbi:MAG TPA: SDR family oxidoreductase [Iamia sp.]|nr:SDR family oxidoreductase [Iamia sp.]
MFSLDGQKALVTGGAGLLGEVFASALAGAGAAVTLLDVDAERLAAVAERLAARRIDVDTAVVDITDEASVARVVQGAAPFDVMVNGAAIDPKVSADAVGRGSALLGLTTEDFRASTEVNLVGMFTCTREAVRAMEAHGRAGVIVNVASVYGVVAPDQRLYEPPTGPAGAKPVDYPATKAGVIGLTRAAAAACGHLGIRVNALVPGGVRAEQPEWFVDAYGRRTMLGRMAETDDLAGPLVFLCSDASRYMTAATLVVDGGLSQW